MAKWFLLEDLPIRVTARGDWLHGDEPLHPRVADLFARHVLPSPDGTYAIALGMARQPLVVTDTPYRVRRLRLGLDAAGALQEVRLHLSDGQEEVLDPSTLMQSADNALYCRITRHGLRVPCKLAPGQYHELALHAEVEGETARLRLGGKSYGFAPFSPLPLPA